MLCVFVMSDEAKNIKKTKEELLSVLTDKQRRFCEEYAIDWNGTRSAKAAGYSENSARAQAYENLTKPYIQAYLEYIRSNLSEAAGISALWVALEYKKQVVHGAADIYDDWISRKDFNDLPKEVKDCIKRVETKIIKRTINEELYDVEMVKVEFYDKQTALKALRELTGYDAPKRTELTGKDGADLAGTHIYFGEDARPLTNKEKEENPDYIEGNNVPSGIPLDQIDVGD